VNAGVRRSSRIQSLQTVRILAALGVVQYHLWNNYFGISIGHPGTDFFLVLVGFVSAWSQAKYIPTGRWRWYMESRYLRLYVTYVPVFFLTLAAKWSERQAGWAVRSFFFIPQPDGDFPVVSVTWMLTLFVLFYWVFDVAFVARTERILVPIFCAWALGIAAYGLWNWSPPLPTQWANAVFTPRNLEILMGYCGAAFLRSRPLGLRGGALSLAAGIAGIVIGVALLNVQPGDAMGLHVALGLLTTVAVIGLAALEQLPKPPLVTRILTRPWLVWIGATSYVLFLTHGLFISAWARFLPMTVSLVPVVTAGAMVAAAIVYESWERPVLASLRRRLGLHSG
jgi:peptidoglycan/LPS O-acetylase OafA/YrhL